MGRRLIQAGQDEIIIARFAHWDALPLRVYAFHDPNGYGEHP